MCAAKKVDLQKKIDDIDVKLYNLLMLRTDLVEQQNIDVVENTLGKEAAVIKKLLKIHRGDFPEYVIAKIWREILSASACLKEKLTFSVFENEKCPDLINIVQEHFGSYADYETYGSFGQVINAVSSGEAQVGVIPCDNHEMNSKPWWTGFSSGDDHIKIIAKLPFLKRKEAADCPEVYAVALSQPDESGDDVSLFGVEVNRDVSFSTVTDTLENAGFSNAKMLIAAPVDHETKSLLVEVDGFVKPTDRRLAAPGKVFNNLNIAGAYAKPVSL